MAEEQQQESGQKKVLDIKKLLKSVLAYGSSDLHLVVGSEPQIRIDKELRPLNIAPLSGKEIEDLMAEAIIKQVGDKPDKLVSQLQDLLEE